MKTQCFIKLGKEKYLENLLNQGELYCNPISFFRQCGEANGVGDRYEGSCSIRNYKNANVSLNFLSLGEIPLSTSNIHLHMPEDPKGNIYCLNNSWVEDGKVYLHPKLIELGSDYDCAVVIFNQEEFMKRVVQSLEKLPYSYKADLVNYYNEKECENNEYSCFDKRKKYSYQNEYRIYIEYDKNSPFSVKIGSITDIAFIKKLPNS